MKKNSVCVSKSMAEVVVRACRKENIRIDIFSCISEEAKAVPLEHRKKTYKTIAEKTNYRFFPCRETLCSDEDLRFAAETNMSVCIMFDEDTDEFIELICRYANDDDFADSVANEVVKIS